MIASFRAPETNAALNGYAAAGFYYALLEVLFDVMYALGPRVIGFDEFRRLKWREKFTQVLPPKTDRTLKRLYDQLVRTKREFRDPVLHGLGGDVALLVEGPAGIGLVPVSYEALGRSMSFSTVEGDAERAKAALGVFRETDQWLETNPPACFALEFARSGFAIPFHSDRVAGVLLHMTDMEIFRKWLLDEANAEDARQDYW
jgi:hypothetical protein